MAYQYDAFGNVIGEYESEEERRKREQEEAAAERPPVKQTITTDPVTGEQTMKVEGSVQDLSPQNPLTPTVAPGYMPSAMTMPQTQPAPASVAPVQPVALENYDRMLQVESGNRDFDAQGRPITSPKGAMYAAQVMPSTAAKPGFGIRPAADQTPAEYNRVGREYYQAMLNKYPGQPELGRAAYNAGPGAVDAAIKKSMLEGGSPLDYLPKETRDYVQRTARPATAQPQPQVQAQPPAPAPAPVAPAPQAEGPMGPPSPFQPGSPTFAGPPAPVAPAPMVDYSLATGTGAPGIQVPGMQPTVPSAPMATAQNRFLEIQDDPAELLNYAKAPDVPDYLKQRAGGRAYDLLKQQQEKEQAERQVKGMVDTGDSVGIARTLKSKDGSWAKLILMGFISPTLAAAEAEKLGLMPSKYETSTITDADGTVKAIEIEKSASGKVLSANYLDGTPLSSKEMNTISAGTNLDLVGGTYVNDITGEVGRVVSDKKTGKSYIQTDAGRRPMTGFRPQGQGGTLDMQRASQIQKQNIELATDWAKAQMRVQTAAPEAANKYLGEFNAKHKTNFTLQDLQGSAPQLDLQTGQMVSAPAAAPAPAAPPVAQRLPAAPVTQPPSAAPAPAPAVRTTPSAAAPVVGGGGGSPAAIEEATRLREIEAKKGAEVSGAEQKLFVEKVIPEVQKKGDDGKFIADTRRTQVNMLTGANSAIMGIYRGSGSTYDKARAVIRDAVSGAYADKDGAAKLSEDLRGISIPAEQLSALKEFAQLNTGINAKTLAENAGEGPKSDADMRLNREANMTNIGDLPAFAALTGLTRSQFAGDVNKRKQDFLNSNRDQYTTQSQLEGAWSKEKDALNRQFESIYRARLNYIDGQMVQKYGKDWRKKSDDDTQAFYRNASIHSFNVYPTPNYDSQTQRFVYPTQQSKIAAMRAITGR